MIRRSSSIIFAVLLLASCTGVENGNRHTGSGVASVNGSRETGIGSSSSQTNNQKPITNNRSSPPSSQVENLRFPYPLPNGASRITKKPFGIYVTPQTSPVQPERFTGYHTGTDFETLPSEQNTTVTAHAICEGTALYRGWVSGYGGVFIQSCTYQGQPVTVLYGHLNVDTITKNTGDAVTSGDAIGNLGQGYSHETDGERKHLHVGIHKGSAIDFKGYVQTKAELGQWIDGFSQ